MKVRCKGAPLSPMRWLAVTSSLLFTASPALAAELAWNAPQGCSSDVFVGKLEEAAEQRLETVAVAKIAIVVRQDAANARQWQLELSFHDAANTQSPTRTLTGTSCEDVSRAAAVAVATALHDEAPEPQAEPLAVPSAAPSGVASAEPSVEPKVSTPAVEAVPQREKRETPTSPASRSWHVPVQVFAGVDGSMQGVASIGFGARVGATYERLHVGLRGVYWPTVTLGTDVAVELQTRLAMLDVCFDLTRGAVRPRVCLGYEAGQVIGRGSGTGVSVARRQVAFWHALQPELGIVADLSAELFFAFGVAGAVALSDAVFVFDAGRVAHDLPAFSLRAYAGLGWLF